MKKTLNFNRKITNFHKKVKKKKIKILYLKKIKSNEDLNIKVIKIFQLKYPSLKNNTKINLNYKQKQQKQNFKNF